MAPEPQTNVGDAKCGCACHDGCGHMNGCDHCKEDPMAGERKKLEAMQKTTDKTAMKIGAEALAYMMSMGWTFGAALTEIKDEQGNVVKHKAELVVRPCTLAEWQAVQKEKLRKSLTL